MGRPTKIIKGPEMIEESEEITRPMEVMEWLVEIIKESEERANKDTKGAGGNG